MHTSGQMNDGRGKGTRQLGVQNQPFRFSQHVIDFKASSSHLSILCSSKADGKATALLSIFISIIALSAALNRKRKLEERAHEKKIRRSTILKNAGDSGVPVGSEEEARGEVKRAANGSWRTRQHAHRRIAFRGDVCCVADVLAGHGVRGFPYPSRFGKAAGAVLCVLWECV